ncbi:MAG TPA: hypothetical protein VFQ54_13630, partial [Thermomicrobiales bacterium]|nr:hypothetical protein [Thermomicrobiales bacterium]
IAENDTSAQQTAAAQQQTIDSQQQTQEAVIENQNAVNARATEAANDEATRNALSASDRATQDAQSTQQAVESQATISAFATQQAEAANSNGDLNSQLATTEAQATEQAASGVDTQGTIASLQGQIASNNNSLSTSQAQANSFQATSEALTQQQGNVQATISAAEQQAAANSLNPTAINLTVNVDLDGVNSNDASADNQAKQQLDSVFAPYVNGTNCTIGFVLISSRSDELGEGVTLSDNIADLIQQEFPQLLATQSDGTKGLAHDSIALPGTSPAGQVLLEVFVNQGCKPAT